VHLLHLVRMRVARAGDLDHLGEGLGDRHGGDRGALYTAAGGHALARRFEGRDLNPRSCGSGALTEPSVFLLHDAGSADRFARLIIPRAR
jgi:hypothetical protein